MYTSDFYSTVVALSDTNLSYFYNFDDNRPDVCALEFFSRERWTTDEAKFDRKRRIFIESWNLLTSARWRWRSKKLMKIFSIGTYLTWTNLGYPLTRHICWYAGYFGKYQKSPRRAGEPVHSQNGLNEFENRPFLNHAPVEKCATNTLILDLLYPARICASIFARKQYSSMKILLWREF